MISKATLGRLPRYLAYLKRQDDSVRDISAAVIARGLSLGDVQVRKDLSSVCGSGKPKTGYNRLELISCMENTLGHGCESEAVVVGAGKLGQALLSFGGFREYGIVLKTAFDNAPEKIGGQVLPIEDLPSYCTLHQVEIGILTVPPETAQATAEYMVRAGIRAIWCFSASSLSLPEGISVHYENLALSLAHLRQKTV